MQADECNPIGKRFPDKSFLCGNIFSPLDQNTANNQLLIYFRFFLIPKAKPYYPQSRIPPEIPWTRCITALLSILRLFDPPPNAPSQSLAQPQSFLSISGCPEGADRPGRLSEFIGVSRGAQSFPQACRPRLPQRDAEPVVTVCVVSGSHANSHSHKIMTI